jgi:hypothetical protein
MNKRLLVNTLLVATLATSTFAGDIDGDTKNDLISENIVEDTKDYWQLRIGMIGGSGTYFLKNLYGMQSEDGDINSASGYEFSLVSDKSNQIGFDYRSVLTLQFNDWTNQFDKDFSDIMFLGEGELAYNINKYVSPFIGYYGGIGATDASTAYDSYFDSSSQITYDLGFFAGVSGNIYEDFDYYAKYNFFSTKGFNVNNDTIGYRMSPTTLRIGVSYTF